SSKGPGNVGHDKSRTLPSVSRTGRASALLRTNPSRLEVCRRAGGAPAFAVLEDVSKRPRTGCWRREWDSNPRYGFPYTRFPSVRLQPLGHPPGQGEAGLGII